MKLVYNIKDKPKFGQLIVFAFQQLLAILAATIAVPSIIGNGMSQSAALFGAGVGTIVYLLFTKFNSPVFLGSSFAFLGSMGAAFAGAISEAAGHAGHRPPAPRRDPGCPRAWRRPRAHQHAEACREGIPLRERAPGDRQGNG